MYSKLVLVFLCALLPSSTLAGQQIILKGRLMDDSKRPVAQTRITAEGFEDVSDSNGYYQIKFSGNYVEGQRVLITVGSTKYVVNSPVDGEWNLPNIKLQNVQTLDISLVPKGSKKLWTHKRIEKLIAKLSDENAKLQKDGQAPKPINFSFYLAEWADRYGFTPDEVKAQFNEWAERVKDSEDFKTLGLRAYYLKNIKEAAEHLGKAGDNVVYKLNAEVYKLNRAKEQISKYQLEAYQIRKLEGNCRFDLYEFREALACYIQAKNYVTENDSESSFEIDFLIANSKQQLGIRVPGAECSKLLTEAISTYEAILQASPTAQKANVQNNLGVALFWQGSRIGGNESIQMLEKAVSCFQAGLRVYTQQNQPQLWASTENNLGIALERLGVRVGGREGIRHLSLSISSYRQALRVLTRNNLPDEWAKTQINLGVSLRALGEQTQGKEGMLLLDEAINVIRSGSEVISPSKNHEDWATYQHHLAMTLTSKGKRIVDHYEKVRLFEEAISAYQFALTIRTRETLAQDWAATQENLGIALFETASLEEVETERREKLLSEAISAFRAALTVLSPDTLSQDWATTLNCLGSALSMQGIRERGESSVKLLSEAIACFQNALTVFTPETFPQLYAEIQGNLGTTLAHKASKVDNESRLDLLSESTVAFRKALQYYDSNSFPNEWAIIQYNLGTAILKIAQMNTEKIDQQLLSEAVIAYKIAHKIFINYNNYQMWKKIQNQLCKIYLLQDKDKYQQNCIENNHFN